MRILVTGGTGFIGSHLVERLVKKGLEVRVSVRETSNIKYLPSGVTEIRDVELLDPESVNEVLKDVEAVFHLASIRGSGWSFDDKKVYEVNVGITKNLLRASVTHGIRHFVYISSVGIYGHPHGGPIDEEYPCTPVTRYGRTKNVSEKLAAKLYREKKLPVTIIRPVITYGPRDTWGMIPKLITLVNSKQYLTVGSGKNRVHLIYIDDFIEGVLHVLNNQAAIGKTYNLGGEVPVTINRLVAIISSALNKKVPILHIPMWFAWCTGYFMEVSYRLFSIDKEPIVTRDKIDIMCRDRTFNITKAKKDLGFAPRIGYEEGINKTIDWLKMSKLL